MLDGRCGLKFPEIISTALEFCVCCLVTVMVLHVADNTGDSQ